MAQHLHLAVDLVVALAALVGAVLGIYNFFHQRRKERVNLQVIPKSAFLSDSGPDGKDLYFFSPERFLKDGNPPDSLAFEIINKSVFPVMIQEVGFLLKRTKGRFAIPQPITEEGVDWPGRIPARESIKVYCRIVDVLGLTNAAKIKCAYASTSCGVIAEGRSRALNEMVRFISRDA